MNLYPAGFDPILAGIDLPPRRLEDRIDWTCGCGTDVQGDECPACGTYRDDQEAADCRRAVRQNRRRFPCTPST